MSPQPDRGNQFDEIHVLVTARAEGTATPEQSDRLKQLLMDDEAARTLYVRYIQETVALRKMAAGDKVSGTALAAGDSEKTGGLRLEAVGKKEDSKPARSANQEVPSIHIPHSTFHISRSLAIAVVVAFVVLGTLAYTFWPGLNQAAKIANLTDAKWTGASCQEGDMLTAGHRLVLQSGLAQITFNSQARAIIEGPAELTIVDAMACRLSYGRLTARVPDPAKGFRVHTPGGTVTDLGTEFGVFVKVDTNVQRADANQGQQTAGGPSPEVRQPRLTEVHVFRGQVAIGEMKQPMTAPVDSEVQNLKSQILSAGHAVELSAHAIKALPAAEPAKFALAQLNRLEVLNSSFEDPNAADGLNAVPTHWSYTGTWKKPVFDPLNAQFAGTTGDNVNAQGVLPDGGQVGFVSSDGVLWQTLDAEVFPGRTYELEFWVGCRADGSYTTNYRVELLAGDEAVIRADNPVTPGLGRFERVVLKGTAGADATGSLTIRFTSLEGLPARHAQQSFFDRVRLTLTDP